MFKTSYNEEFKWPERTTWGIKKWPRDRIMETEKIISTPPMYRNSETLSTLTKECLTPFDYLFSPKPILQTNPSSPYPTLELPQDDGNARLTRPRVYKAPEISLDDIEDQDIRKKIIDYTYSTTWGMASRDAAERIIKRRLKDSTWELPYHFVFRKEDLDDTECDVRDTKIHEWKRSQSRVAGDPTTAFWRQYRTKIPVKLIDQAAIDIKSPKFTDDILCLAREKRLRLPYMLRPPNYTGFMPENPIDIESEKRELEFSDPMISVSQLANRWREI